MISCSGTSSKPSSVSMPFRYLIGLPLGSWIIRKAIVPSVEVAGNILTGTRTSERRRLPDQTGMGAMGHSRNATTLLEIWGSQGPPQVNKNGSGNPRHEHGGVTYILQGCPLNTTLGNITLWQMSLHTNNCVLKVGATI